MPNTSTARPIPLHPKNTVAPGPSSSLTSHPRAGAEAGLSRGHNSPPGSKLLSVARGGAYTRISAPLGPRPAGDRKPRGKIYRYTARSRSRLFQAVAKVRRDQCPPNNFFLTLTYPDEYSADARVWHRDLDAFLKRWFRRFPRSFLFWKLEPQKRGAPHFHLLVWSWGGYDKAWLSRSWYEVVGSGDPNHLKAGTSWEAVKSEKRIVSYAAKYVGKMPEGEVWESPGRFWGVANRKLMPTTELTMTLTDWEFFRLRRLMRRQLKKKNGYHLAGGSRSGCWVGWSEEELRRVLRYLGDLKLWLEGRSVQLAR